MNKRSLTALLLVATVLASACGARRSHPDLTRKQIELPTHHIAWTAARSRLHAMCPGVPRTEADLDLALKVRHPNDCYIRFAKDTYVPTADDWHWHWLPPYSVVAAVHEEEIRKRMVPRLYEEYMSGLNRFLSEKADRAEITPAQFRYAFNAGWSWVTAKTRNERFLLENNDVGARHAGAAGQGMISNMAGELATLTTLALSVSAQDKRYEPVPATCYADFDKDLRYTIWCY